MTNTTDTIHDVDVTRNEDNHSADRSHNNNIILHVATIRLHKYKTQ